MIKRLMRFTTTLCTDRRIRTIALAGYYLAILGGVFVLGTLSAFTTPTFVYQGF